jgi:hypothetical protein
MKGLERKLEHYSSLTVEQESKTMNPLMKYITNDLLNEYANTRDKLMLMSDTLGCSIDNSNCEHLEQLVIDCCSIRGIEINWFD